MISAELKGGNGKGENFIMRMDDQGRLLAVTGKDWATCDRKYYREHAKMVSLEKIIQGIRMMQEISRGWSDKRDRLAQFMAEHPDCRLLMNAKTHEAAIKAGLELPQERVIVSEHVEGGRIYLVAKEMATPRMETL